MTRFTAFLAAALLLISGCMPTTLAQEVVTEPVVEPPGLWIDLSMGPELVDWFNAAAYREDIARVDDVSLIDLLDNIEVGRRLVVFKNVADAEALVPRLAEKMDVIGYNLEHGPSNRPDEQADPVGSVRRMRALADEYGLELALGPDRAFALSDGVAMAPFVDMFVLQIQRAQTEPAVVRDFVLPLAAQLRAVNPDVEISVQVRTEGDPVAIADLVMSMEDSLDGVSILTSAESIDIAEALVAELRPPAPEPPPPTPQPAPTQSDSQAVVLPTPSATPRRSATASPNPAITAAPPGNTQTSERTGGWLLLGSAAGMGLLITGLMATAAYYAFQKIRFR